MNFFSFLLFFDIAFLCYGQDATEYFNKNFLERIINNVNVFNKDKTLIFDENCRREFKIYGAISLYPIYDYWAFYIDYEEYNIMVLISSADNIVKDYLILKKETQNMHFQNGAVEINGEYFDWNVTIVVNNHWRGRYSTDISSAYIINVETEKIEKLEYRTIKIYAED